MAGSRRPRGARQFRLLVSFGRCEFASGVSVFGCRDKSGFCASMVGVKFLEGTLTLAVDKEALTIMQSAWKIKLILQCAWRGEGGFVNLTRRGRLYGIAQGFNPGRDVKRGVPSKRHQTLARLVKSTSHLSELTVLGRHFQGASFGVTDPGLNPWAVLYNRCAVNTAHTRKLIPETSFRGIAKQRNQRRTPRIDASTSSTP